MLQESALGAVYLERIADRSFQAAHPIKLAPDILSRVLRGVLVKDEQRLLQNLIAGKPDAVRVFKDDEINYLAPLLAKGLSQAASDQQVGFRITQTETPMASQASETGVGSSEPTVRHGPSGATSGTIYAYGRSLYLSLTHYHPRKEPADTPNIPDPRTADLTGLANRSVMFTPESAKRPDSYKDARSSKSTLIIDYELLARLPIESPSPPAAQTAPTAATPQAGPSVKEHPPGRDAEIEALRKELEEIKRQLAEQQVERTKKKSTPQK